MITDKEEKVYIQSKYYIHLMTNVTNTTEEKSNLHNYH